MIEKITLFYTPIIIWFIKTTLCPIIIYDIIVFLDGRSINSQWLTRSNIFAYLTIISIIIWIFGILFLVIPNVDNVLESVIWSNYIIEMFVTNFYLIVVAIFYDRPINIS
jgi:hypothetical protein